MSERDLTLLRRALAGAGILFLLGLVVFAEFHQPSRLLHTLQKLAHPTVFGAMALLLLALRPRLERPGLRACVVAFTFTVLLGAVTEIAQSFVHRDPSLFDVARDAWGAATALACCAALLPGPALRTHRLRRAAVAVAALVGGAVMLWPLALCLAAYAHRDASFPRLLETCSRLDRYFLTVSAARVESVAPEGGLTSPCGRVFRIDISGDGYPGLRLEEPYPDWRGARTLQVELRNPGGRDLPLALRVHDRAHARSTPQLYSDRFNREFVLPAHAHLELEVPVGEIAQAPAGRPMDLAQVAGLGIFRTQGAEPAAFEIGGIALLRGSAAP